MNALVSLNGLICLVGVIMCVCRLSKMKMSTTKTVVRFQHVLWTTLFAASGLMGWASEAPSVAQVLLGAGMVVYFIMGSGAWWHGLPTYARKEPQ